jgi:hypothetical protein
LKLSGIPHVLFIVCLALPGLNSFGQAQPAAGPSVSERPATWDVFMGGSYGYARTSTDSYYGWNAAVSEYPYRAHPWIGGTVEASGLYDSQSGTTNDEYIAMGGPSLMLRSRSVEPFARVMLGGVINTTPMKFGNIVAPASHNFGMSGGGGLDLPIGSRCAIRAEADWIRFWAQSQGYDMLRASAGVVFRF